MPARGSRESLPELTPPQVRRGTRLPQGACASATGGRQSFRRRRGRWRMWVETMATLGDVCYAVRDDRLGSVPSAGL